MQTDKICSQGQPRETVTGSAAKERLCKQALEMRLNPVDKDGFLVYRIQSCK